MVMQKISDKMNFHITVNRQKNIPWKVDGYNIHWVYVDKDNHGTCLDYFVLILG